MSKAGISGWTAALATLAVGLFFWWYSAALLDAEHQMMVRRLARAAESLIQTGHRQKDDLLIQQTLQGLGAAPGVVYAAVVDPSRRALAHSDPAQLGKAFHPSRGKGYGFDLRDSEGIWGRLYIGLAEGPDRLARQSWSLILAAGLAVIGFLWAWTIHLWRTTVRALEQDRDTLRQLAGESESQRTRAELLVQKERESSRLAITEALRLVNKPVLILDENQKVSAFTHVVPRFLEESGDDLFGKAWHEVKRLQEQGPALEESLSRPETAIDTGSAEGRLRIRTLKDRSASWVAFD